jgi:hypothetical protein
LTLADQLGHDHETAFTGNHRQHLRGFGHWHGRTFVVGAPSCSTSIRLLPMWQAKRRAQDQTMRDLEAAHRRPALFGVFLMKSLPSIDFGGKLRT